MNKINVKYYEVIKQIYPEMQRLSEKEYNEISKEIISNINSGKNTEQSVKKLYDKMLVELGYFASLYARSNLSEELFLDALNGCYFRIIDKFNEMVGNCIWFKNYNSYAGDVRTIAEVFIKDCKNQQSNSILIRRTIKKNGKNSDLVLKSDTKNLKNNQSLVNIKKVSFDYLDEELPEYSYEIMENVFKDLLNSIIHSAVRTLSAKECRVLTLYFGLDGEEPMSLRKIAAKYNVSPEAIRVIVKKSLIKMRHPTRLAKIKDFVT